MAAKQMPLLAPASHPHPLVSGPLRGGQVRQELHKCAPRGAGDPRAQPSDITGACEMNDMHYQYEMKKGVSTSFSL